MERSMNNGYIMSKHETTTFSGDQSPEESSWTMYFEDFFEASSSKVDVVGDCSSSVVSDAASFVATKKTFHVSKEEGSNKFDMKKTGNREIPFGRHHDLEDTASSPSHSPNVCTMMSLLENNTSHGDCIVCDTTINEKRENGVRKQGGLSVDLTKKGLCLVPLSIVTNFLVHCLALGCTFEELEDEYITFTRLKYTIDFREQLSVEETIAYTNPGP